jgi:hypothetical protein
MQRMVQLFLVGYVNRKVRLANGTFPGQSPDTKFKQSLYQFLYYVKEKFWNITTGIELNQRYPAINTNITRNIDVILLISTDYSIL